MKQLYIKSLQMIKSLNIESELQYNKMLRQYIILNTKTLKYMAGTRSFKKIIKIANQEY